MSMIGFFIVFGILFSPDDNIALLPGDNTALLSTEDKMKKQSSRNEVSMVS